MDKKDLTIILDPAHGANVPGKQSPDGSHKEFLWSRDICNVLYELLLDEGYTVKIDNLTQDEIGLMNRRKFANELPGPGIKKLLLSFHNNASGSGTKWGKARGYEIYTWLGQTLSDDIATELLNSIDEQFNMYGLTERVDFSDGDPDKESRFTILGGDYNACLIEWLFMDNEQDLALLKNSKMNAMFAESIVHGVNMAFSKFFRNLS